MILHYSFIHTLGGTGCFPSRGSPVVEPPLTGGYGRVDLHGCGTNTYKSMLNILTTNRYHIVTIVNFGSSGKTIQQSFVAFRLCFNWLSAVSRGFDPDTVVGPGGHSRHPVSHRSAALRCIHITEACHRTSCSGLSQPTAHTGVACTPSRGVHGRRTFSRRSGGAPRCGRRASAHGRS